jgi:hypothetical protein
MKKLLILSVVAVTGAFASSAFAAQPVNPGCFGQDRAAWLAAHSGAEWGVIAGERAGDNGAINRAYKDACGG